MSLRPYIPINVDNLPERFEFKFGLTTYILQVNYNAVGDFYTVDILTARMEPIVMGEILVLNQKLWQDSSDTRLPFEDIVPMDEANNETVITSENFGVTVFLYIDTISPDKADKTNGAV